MIRTRGWVAVAGVALLVAIVAFARATIDHVDETHDPDWAKTRAQMST